VGVEDSNRGGERKQLDYQHLRSLFGEKVNGDWGILRVEGGEQGRDPNNFQVQLRVVLSLMQIVWKR